MAFELKEGQGSLFKNDKDGVDTRPDYTGTMKVNGQVMRLAAWVKTSNDGTKKFLSLNLSEQRQKQEQHPIEADNAADDTDPLPF